MPYGRHIYAKACDIEKYEMCAYHQPGHALPHWKFVLRFWFDFSYINLPNQNIDNQY